MIRQDTQQTTLHRERLIQKLFVEMLLDIVDKNASHSMIVILGSTGPTHHLEHIRDGHVGIALLLGIVIFSAFDHD